MLPLKRLPLLRKPFEIDIDSDVSGKAIAETVDYLKKEGGETKVSELIEIINGEVISPYNSLQKEGVVFSEEVANNHNYNYTLKFWYLFNIAMKQVMGDPFFRFEAGGKRLSADHKVFEKGPLERSPYGHRVINGQHLGVKGRSIKSCIDVLRKTADVVTHPGVVAGSSATRRLEDNISAIANQRVRDLLDLVNSFLGEKWVSEDELVEEDVTFDYEFVQIVYDSCKIVSEDHDFFRYVGEHNVSLAVKVFLPLRSQLSLEKGIKTAQEIGKRFANVTEYSSLFGENCALISMKLKDHFKDHEYYNSMLANSWSMVRSTILSIADNAYNSRTKVLAESQSGEDGQSLRGMNLSRQIDEGIESLLEKGELENSCSLIFLWEPYDKGIRRFFRLPTTLSMVCSAGLAGFLFSTDIDYFHAFMYSVSSLSIPVITHLLVQIKEARIRNSNLLRVISKQETVNEYKTRELRTAVEEIRHKLSERILTNAFNHLLNSDYDQAIAEFKDYMEHSIDHRALLGYTVGVYRKRAEYLPEVLGARIKIVGAGEELQDRKYLQAKYFFKECDSLLNAKKLTELSGLLSDVGVPKVQCAFGDESEGYVVVEQVCPRGEPGVRAPNLLELHDDDLISRDDFGMFLDLAARMYTRLFEIDGKRSGLIDAVRKDGVSANTRDYLERIVRKCVGLPGGEEPHAAGLYSYISDSRTITEFEQALRAYSSPLFRLLSCLKPGIAFDFSPKNVVLVDQNTPVLVDIDRINDMDMPRFFSTFTEMGDFLPDILSPIQQDIAFGQKTVLRKGTEVSSKDLLFFDFISRLYSQGSPDLSAIIESDAGEWFHYMPVGRFFRALAHFGSFSHWSRKYADMPDESIKAKRQGIECLGNVVRSIDDVIGRLGVSGNDRAELCNLKESFRELILKVKLAGKSDLHVHGGNSHCVIKEYGTPISPGSSIESKLSFIEERLTEKLDALKGMREHVCIVEHTRFVEYRLPFSCYKSVFDGVRSRYRDAFASISFGLELDMVRNKDGSLAFDLDNIDESASAVMKEKTGGKGLSNVYGLLRSADVLLVGLHYQMFRENGAYSVIDGRQYARHLTDAAKLLAGLKEEYGPDKIYVLVHPWKCASDINRFNEVDNRKWRINLPDASDMEDFFRLIYDNDLVFDVNARELRHMADAKGNNRVQNGSLSLLGMAISYFKSRNEELGNDRRLIVARTSDAHTRKDVGLFDSALLAEHVKGMGDDIVLINP